MVCAGCEMDLCESPPPLLKAKEKDCVVPVTPEVVKENADFEFQSPLTLTLVRKQLNGTLSINDSHTHSPRTPKDVIFNPFAKDTRDEFRSSAVRQLHFRSSVHNHEYDSLSDQQIFESVFDNLLHFILSKKMEEEEEGFLPPISNLQHCDSDDHGCKSPPSLLRFTGIAHTCPPAPHKLKPTAAHQPKIIQLELCKKLEF